MSQGPKDPPSCAPSAAARAGLRLVRDDDQTAPVQASVEPVVGSNDVTKARRRSPFLDFMNAYADAVDQQVKVLLER